VKTKIVKYKGDRAASRGIEKMGANGWTVQTHNTRKAMFSLLAGVFTRKQIHTVTFVKQDA